MPRRGEVWRAQLDPALGSEQAKTRPVVVLTEPPTGRASIRLCVPVVHAKLEHGLMVWCAPLVPSSGNGLSKDSSADTAQTRALDLVRFGALLGSLTTAELETVTAALVLCVGHAPAKPKPGGE
jgi:mRNA interferase MazF